MKEKYRSAQADLVEQNLDGWLLYDFRRSNDLAIHFLEIPDTVFLTRRFFYWIPASGEPEKLVSAIEEHVLDSLLGTKRVYRSWQELHDLLRERVGGKKVAMEYSPFARVPTVSKVDGGTLELIRGLGAEVVSSATLLLRHSSVLSEKQVAEQLAAAQVVDQTVDEVWRWIEEAFEVGRPITEVEVQEEILKSFARSGCETEGRPIVAVNAHAADPHYAPDPEAPHQIRRGDLVLIDLWCKKCEEGAPFADITRMGVIAEEPTPRQQEIFTLVREARDAAIELVKSRFNERKPLFGWEVDQAARDVIEKAGYGKQFVHRTGHSITSEEHGPGTNMDNLETEDERPILPGTCFSIEPGIYLTGELGVRMEVDLLVHEDGRVEVTGGCQKELMCLRGR